MLTSGVVLGEGSLTVLNPQAPGTQTVYNLGLITFVICAVIFAVVGGIIFYSVIRCRWREGDADPHQFSGNKTVELIWTTIPFIIVIVLFVLTVRTMNSADPDPPKDPDLVVTGHQWWWEVEYPKVGVITANEIHIPVGQSISVKLDSKDVLHEFWVAELTRKMTTVPGHINHVWLRADKPGIYQGVCSEFCGTQHAWMRFIVVAEEPEKYEAWVKAQQAKAAPPQSEDAIKGLETFQKMSCVSCHAINGTGATARYAPDLTHFASRSQFGSGIADNNHENLVRWLKNPQDVKPGVLMPNFNLTDEQVKELSAYFESLK